MVETAKELELEAVPEDGAEGLRLSDENATGEVLLPEGAKKVVS